VIAEQSLVPSPALEERPSTSGAQVTRRAKKSRTEQTSPNVSAKRSRTEDSLQAEPEESSDDEAVELSLIESRCKLMNGDRRVELKEGTSKDYDARGNLSPHSRRKKRRKRDTEESPSGENETSAIRKSVSGLLNSLKKNRLSRGRLSDAGESPVSGRVNGASDDVSMPRVSLMRLGPWSKSNGIVREEIGAEGGPVSPLPMVSRRKRRSYVTTRNKKSRHFPAEEVVPEAPTPQGEPPRRSGKRMSWTELMSKFPRNFKCGIFRLLIPPDS